MGVKNATQHMHVKYESLGAKIIIMGDFCGKKIIPFFKKKFKLFVVFKRIRIKASWLRSPSDNRPGTVPFQVSGFVRQIYVPKLTLECPTNLLIRPDQRRVVDLRGIIVNGRGPNWQLNYKWNQKLGRSRREHRLGPASKFRRIGTRLLTPGRHVVKPIG